MSLASTQCNVLTITMRKADLEYRLLNITNTISRMAAQSAAISEEMMNKIRSQYDFQVVLTDENTKDNPQEIAAINTEEFYLAYQQQMAMVNAKEKLLDAEKQQIETQLKALNTLDEGYQKQLDSNLKKAVLNP